MTDDAATKDRWASIRTILTSLPPAEAERLVDIVQVLADVLRPKTTQRSPRAVQNYGSAIRSEGPACFFDGVLTRDDAVLKPKDHEACLETLRQLTETERRFWGKRLRVQDALTGDLAE